MQKTSLPLVLNTPRDPPRKQKTSPPYPLPWKSSHVESFDLMHPKSIPPPFQRTLMTPMLLFLP